MQKPGVPATEIQRLMALRSLAILDTVAEERFDRISRVARRTFDAPIALVSLVDEYRQWFKSHIGLEITETPREVSFCGHAVTADATLIVPDTAADIRFSDNPLVTGPPNVRFYAGAPLHVDNLPVGTLCILDTRPRVFTPEDVDALQDFAAMVQDEFHTVHHATLDSLTGVTNRRGFEILAQKCLAINNRHKIDSTLLLFDLDEFKQINDRFGHAAGDQALVDFAAALVKCFREADVIARLGGDEFCVLACGGPASMCHPIARLHAHLRTLSNRPYRIHFSVGATPVFSASLPTLLTFADREMYASKKRTRS